MRRLPFWYKGNSNSCQPLICYNKIDKKWYKEVFKPIKNYKGLYEISNAGRIKSLIKNITLWHGGVYKTKEKILKLGIDNLGYLQICLSKNNKRETIRVHILVWNEFGNKPRNGRELAVDHKIENNKKNNRIDNLQLLNHRDNCSKSKLFYRKNKFPTGVSWREQKKKFKAQIQINGKRIFLGYFNNIKDASDVYQNKLREINVI